MTHPDVSAPAPSAERRAQLQALAEALFQGLVNPKDSRSIRQTFRDILLRSDAERSTTPTPCAGPTREQVEALLRFGWKTWPDLSKSFGTRVDGDYIERASVLALFPEAERHG